jgi:hypothetical protein
MNDEDAEDAIRMAEEQNRRERWPSVQKELPDICTELQKLCSIGCGYSLRYVAQRFTPAQRVPGIAAAVESADRWAGRLAKCFRLCETFDPSLQQVEMVFEMLDGVLSDLHRNGIEPFVGLVREEGSAEAAVLDGYGHYRRRWSGLIEQVERLAKVAGLRRDLSAYFAPELNVPLKS